MILQKFKYPLGATCFSEKERMLLHPEQVPTICPVQDGHQLLHTHLGLLGPNVLCQYGSP
jgi:hypothetical protein